MYLGPVFRCSALSLFRIDDADKSSGLHSSMGKINLQAIDLILREECNLIWTTEILKLNKNS